MKPLLCAVLALALVPVAWSAAKRGISPRAKLADYPASAHSSNIAIGAVQLSREQVRNSFASDLERGYVVVEVGVFPAKDATVDLKHDDFSLRVPGTTTLIRPAMPETIARVLQKKNTGSDKDVNLYPMGGVGYETGGRDVYGNNRPGGWSTTAGMGVGIGRAGTKPASTDADRTTMQTELQDKMLPEGSVATPQAGYLYFPIPTRQKVTYQLEYRVNGMTSVLPLTPAKE